MYWNNREVRHDLHLFVALKYLICLCLCFFMSSSCAISSGLFIFYRYFGVLYGLFCIVTHTPYVRENNKYTGSNTLPCTFIIFDHVYI